MASAAVAQAAGSFVDDHPRLLLIASVFPRQHTVPLVDARCSRFPPTGSSGQSSREKGVLAGTNQGLAATDPMRALAACGAGI